MRIYDFTWNDDGDLGLFQDRAGVTYNADPDHGGLPRCPVVSVEAMIRNEADEPIGYAVLSEIPVGATLRIKHPHGQRGTRLVKHLSRDTTLDLLWAAEPPGGV